MVDKYESITVSVRVHQSKKKKCILNKELQDLDHSCTMPVSEALDHVFDPLYKKKKKREKKNFNVLLAEKSPRICWRVQDPVKSESLKLTEIPWKFHSGYVLEG